MQISVIIPTYNRYTLLKRALISVFEQSYQPEEIIVIDDGSFDETVKIQEEFPEIIYIYQENSGVSSARNRGIAQASCEWIAFLDSDDSWAVNKLAFHVKLHSKNPKLLMSYTDEQWIRNGVVVNVPQKYQKYQGSIFEQCLSHCIIAPSSAFLHKKIFEDIGFFDEDLEVCEDYDLWLRITAKYEVGLIREKLITKYAGHEGQLSFKYWGMDRFRVKSLEKFVNSEKKERVRKTLVKKYQLLLKGALKYGKMAEIQKYKEKIKAYE